MAAKVQRTPRGLLALLGIYGANPPGTISDEYRAVFESRDLILAEVETGAFNNNNPAAAVGANIGVTVPPGFVHVLVGANVSVSIPAGPPTYVNLALNIVLGASQQTVAVAQRSSSDGALTVGRFVLCPWQPNGFIVLNPGDGFFGVLNELTGAAAASLTINYTARVIRT